MNEAFKYYFMEDEDPNNVPPEQMQNENPNEIPPEQQMMDPNMQQQQPSAILPEDEEDKFEKEFPMEKDGGNTEQDVINFTNYQKLQYFNKFKELSIFVKTTEKTFNKAKTMVSFDNLDDEEQHKIINVLIQSLNEIQKQIDFFLEKGIVSVNIDKTRSIFRTQIRKLNLIIDKFEELMRNVKQKN